VSQAGQGQEGRMGRTERRRDRETDGLLSLFTSLRLSFSLSLRLCYNMLMAKTEKKASGKVKEPEIKLVSENRKARHRFEILETLECGIQLTGSEVKSLRDGKLSLDEAYARVKDGEVWMVGADIAEYPQATLWNHAPKRPRKLLLKREERLKFANKAHEKGLTLV